MTDHRLIDLPNIGAYSAHELERVDIVTTHDLRQLGAVQAYHRIWFHAERKPTDNLLWALAGALDGRHWKSYDYHEKQALLNALEAHRKAQTLHDELQA
jgi:DNA transformation protein